MKYVFNPRNQQINPVTEVTHVDASLRDKIVSAELYALVCKGKVSIGDIAAMFAVGKSPEILVKNHAVVKESPMAKAPPVTETLQEPKTGKPDPEGDAGNSTMDNAFDGRELSSKKLPELLIIAGTVGIDVNAEGFVPTRGNLIKAIMAKADKAEKSTPPVPITPVTSGGEPIPPME